MKPAEPSIFILLKGQGFWGGSLLVLIFVAFCLWWLFCIVVSIFLGIASLAVVAWVFVRVFEFVYRLL